MSRVMISPTASGRRRRRKCLNDPQLFCYICSKYCTSTRPFTAALHEAFGQWFNPLKPLNLDKKWCPNEVCDQCYTGLVAFLRAEANSFRFKTPTIWRHQDNHEDDCHFCLTVINTDCSKITYPDIKSVDKPTLYSEGEDTAKPKVSGKSKSVVKSKLTNTTNENHVSRPKPNVKREYSQVSSEKQCSGDKPLLISSKKMKEIFDSLGKITNKQESMVVSFLKEHNLLKRGVDSKINGEES